MAQIFISYKRYDKKKVFKIKDQIESVLGKICWIDIDGIESDAQFKSVIINAINESKVVLFMYSKIHTKIVDFEKDWTIRELNFAASKNKKIVFVNIDGSQLTDMFTFDYSSKQHVDGRSSIEINKLIEDLQNWLNIDANVTDGNRHSLKKSKLNSGSNFTITHIKTYIATILLLIIGISIITYYIHIQDNKSTTVVKVDTTSHISDLQAVDLALPSKTLWSNMNIGAKDISDYGGLYSWGELSEKENYGQANYNNLPVNAIAGTKYDVATIELGNEWQIPTSDDFDELIKTCKWTWTAINGHNGYQITGTNKKSIFLPASGWICSMTIEHRNVYGYYWSSSKVNNYYSKGLLFSRSCKKTGNGYLYYGRNIRAVKKK